MKLFTLNTGLFKLDGGAMFGVVPKTVWVRLNPPDEKNLCTWALRCLLIEAGNRLILVDAGLGDKQDEKFFSYYEPHGEDSLLNSIRQKGFGPDDITDVILTHLHFDHCGGAVIRKGEKLVPQFSNAIYWSNLRHWEWAMNPNPREKASFLKENFVPLRESGQLRFAEEGQEIMPGISLIIVDGHTEAQMLPVIDTGEDKLVYCADLFPSSHHVRVPYVMAYDIRPLVTMDEKSKLLDRAARENMILFFEHDPLRECARVRRTERGVEVVEFFPLQ